MNRQNVRRYRTLLFVSLLAMLIYSMMPWDPQVFEDFNQVENGRIVYAIGMLLAIFLVFATWKLARAMKISVKLRIIIVAGLFVPYLYLINAVGLLGYACVVLRRDRFETSGTPHPPYSRNTALPEGEGNAK